MAGRVPVWRTRRGEVVALLGQGVPVEDVCRRLSMTGQQVDQALAEDAKVRQVVALRERSLNQQQVAAEMGLHPITVGKIAGAAGIRFPRGENLVAAARRADRSRLRDDCLELLEEGWSVREVSDLTDVPNGTVSAWASEAQIPTGSHSAGIVAQVPDGVSRPVTLAKVEKLRKVLAMVEEGYGARAIADAVGVGLSTVTKWAGQAGLKCPIEPAPGSLAWRRQVGQELLGMGVSPRTVSDRVGTRLKTVLRWAQQIQGGPQAA